MGETAFIGKENGKPQLWLVPMRWKHQWFNGRGFRVRPATKEESEQAIARPARLIDLQKQRERKRAKLARLVREERLALEESDEQSPLSTPSESPAPDPHPPATETPAGQLCDWCEQTYRNVGAHKRFCPMRPKEAGE